MLFVAAIRLLFSLILCEFVLFFYSVPATFWSTFMGASRSCGATILMAFLNVVGETLADDPIVNGSPDKGSEILVHRFLAARPPDAVDTFRSRAFVGLVVFRSQAFDFFVLFYVGTSTFRWTASFWTLS